MDEYSVSTSASSLMNSDRLASDAWNLQRRLKDKENELQELQQTTLELTEKNKELQTHLNEQYVSMQTMEAKQTDYEMKIDLLQAQNGEYQQMVNQTNDKYEESLHELSLTREQLNHANIQIEQYNDTIQSLNHDLINNTNQTTKSLRNGHSQNQKSEGVDSSSVDYKHKLETLQKQYKELIIECTKYRDDHQKLMEQQIEQQIHIEELRKFEKRNKLLSDQIIELTYNNVELEKEINECSQEMDQQQQTIQYLQTENQNLMIENQKKNQLPLPPPQKLAITRTDSVNSNGRNQPLITPKIVMSNRSMSPSITNNHQMNEIDDDHMTMEVQHDNENEENDLFSMVQTYEDNDHYLFNTEMEEKVQDSTNSVSVSPKISALHLDEMKEVKGQKGQRLRNRLKGHSTGHARVLDAQEEYLHLTASAVKINYPTVATTINELLAMARTVPFYNAYTHLDQFMKKKVEENEVECILSGDEEKSPIVEPKGTMAKLRHFGSSMVADILFSKANVKDEEKTTKKPKRRMKRSQSVIVSASDSKKLKRRNKKLKSKEERKKNGKSMRRPIVKLENTKSGIKIAKSSNKEKKTRKEKVSKKENQKPKNGVIKRKMKMKDPYS